MTDYASFRAGGVDYPLSAALTNTALRDADPAIYYLLEYFSAVLSTHMGARLIAEAAACNHEKITKVVGTQLPMNAEPFLLEEQLEFPVLSASREGSKWRYAGQRKIQIHTITVTYVLPPMERVQAERLTPFLKAVSAILDNRTEQGFDPAYTPSGAAAATPGPWGVGFAGFSEIGISEVKYGGFIPQADIFFPAVVMTITAEERQEANIEELALVAGVDASVDLADSFDGSTVETIASIATLPAVVLVGPLSPTTGSKAGADLVQIPCTGLVVGRAYRVLFAGLDAASVVATTTTSLACFSPAIDAYPTRAVDVVVLDQDGGESNTLAAAFTFTSP